MKTSSPTIQTKITKSVITNKWLAQVLKAGQWRTISPHCDRNDAVHAIECIRQQFSGLTQEEFNDLGVEEYSIAISTLDYPDDDEPIGKIRELEPGNFTLDISTKTVGDLRSIFKEHDMLSDAAKERGTWIDKYKQKPRPKARGFG